MSSLRSFVRHTAAGRLSMIPYRLGWAWLQALKQAGRMTAWAFSSKEYYNHTYHLTPLNRRYLAEFTAVVAWKPWPEIERYCRELEDDSVLRDKLVAATLASPDRHSSDAEPRYGRRIGWYALIRALKPKVIVETGVDRGLGTVVIAAALKRNAAEGSPGRVYATDIIPDCGHLFLPEYRDVGEILLGDSVETLKKFSQPVDLFLHDSDHRPEYEWAEFLAIEHCLHPGSIVLSDNSQQSVKLAEFAEKTGRKFLYFQDQPDKHWWPGDGIGAAF